MWGVTGTWAAKFDKTLPFRSWHHFKYLLPQILASLRFTCFRFKFYCLPIQSFPLVPPTTTPTNPPRPWQSYPLIPHGPCSQYLPPGHKGMLPWWVPSLSWVSLFLPWSAFLSLWQETSLPLSPSSFLSLFCSFSPFPVAASPTGIKTSCVICCVWHLGLMAKIPSLTTSGFVLQLCGSIFLNLSPATPIVAVTDWECVLNDTFTTWRDLTFRAPLEHRRNKDGA